MDTITAIWSIWGAVETLGQMTVFAVIVFRLITSKETE